MSGKRKPQNPVIGHMACDDCGERAEVRQATKRGHHFYTTCACGTQMGQGAPRQTKIWNTAEFNAPQGVTVYKPTNVTEGAATLPQPEPQPAPEFEAVEPGSEPARGEQGKRWQPGAAGDSEAAGGEPASDSVTTVNRGALAALAVAVLAIGAGAWMG